MKYLQEISSILKSYEADIKSNPNSAFYLDHYDNTMKFLSIANVKKWVFGDAEDFYSHEQYIDLLESLFHLEYVDTKSLQVRLTESATVVGNFDLEVRFFENAYHLSFEINGDWLNQDVINFLNKALEEGNSNRFFYNVNPTKKSDQCFTYVFISNEIFNQLVQDGFAYKLEDDLGADADYLSDIEREIDNYEWIISTHYKVKRSKDWSEEDIESFFQYTKLPEILSAFKNLKAKITTYEERPLLFDLSRDVLNKLENINGDADFIEFESLLDKFFLLVKSI